MNDSEISNKNFEPSDNDCSKKPVIDGDPCCSSSATIEVSINPEEIFIKQESPDNDLEEYSIGTWPKSSQPFISDLSDNPLDTTNENYDSEDPLLPSMLLAPKIEISCESPTKLNIPADISSENVNEANTIKQENSMYSELNLPLIPPGLAVNLRKKLPEFLNGFVIFQFNDYLGYRTRLQFWEEPGVRRVMEGVKKKKIDMKLAAKILGITYNTMYGRFRKEVYQTIKEAEVLPSRKRKKISCTEPLNEKVIDFDTLGSAKEYHNNYVVSKEEDYTKILKQNMETNNTGGNDSSKVFPSASKQLKPLPSKHSSPSLTTSHFIRQRKEFFNYLRATRILQLNDYMAFPNRTKSQFFEQDYVKNIMQAVRNTFIDMKRAAKILGVTYNVLYPKYIEVYGKLKTSRPKIQRRSLSNKLPKDILELAEPPSQFDEPPTQLAKPPSQLAKPPSQLAEPPSQQIHNVKIEMEPTFNELNLCSTQITPSLKNEYILPVPMAIVPELPQQQIVDSTTYSNFQNLRFDIMEKETNSGKPSCSYAKRKKQEYNCTFQDSWKARPEYRDWIIQIDNAFAKCRFCNISFTVKHDGEKALKTHLYSNRHKTNTLNKPQNQFQNQLLTAIALPHVDQSKLAQGSMAELIQVYHGINHQQNYLSITCGIQLNNKIFNDSKLCKLIKCGRTKAEMLVKNVLWPSSIELALLELRGNYLTNFSCIPFSVTTDAFNKGNINLFPIVVTYFDTENGIKNKVIDFYESSSDSPEEISDQIKNSLERNGLDISNVSSYMVENASLNYEVNKFIFHKLSTINEDILKGHNYSYIIHNAARIGCKMLTYDIENLIIKVFSEFSNCAKRTSGLKDCFDFLDIAYESIIGQSPSKYLSLYHAVERLVNSWPAIKSYFISLGEDECNKVIWSFIDNQSEDPLQESGQFYFTIPELYIYFVYYFMSMMTKTLRAIESTSMTCLEVYDVLYALVNSIENRIQDSFFGNKIQFALQHCNYSSLEKDQFVKEALGVYCRTLDYLRKVCDFQNNPYRYFSVLNLKKDKMDYSEVLHAVQRVKVVLDEDELFDEVQNLNKLLPTINANMPDLTVEQKWVTIFKGLKNFRQLPKLLAKVLSLPVNNTFAESFFSQMKDIWTDKADRQALDLAKAGLCTKVNYNMTCDEFSAYIKKPAQARLLRGALTLCDR